MGGITHDELILEFERLVQEGGIDVPNPCKEIVLEPRYDCRRNMHKWKWYVGFRMEQYYYCEICDTKDTTSPAYFLKLKNG